MRRRVSIPKRVSEVLKLERDGISDRLSSRENVSIPKRVSEVLKRKLIIHS